MSTTIEQSRPANQNRREQRDTYDPIARTLHWLVFALLAVQVAVGWSLPHMSKGTPQEGIVDWHLSIGTALITRLI